MVSRILAAACVGGAMLAAAPVEAAVLASDGYSYADTAALQGAYKATKSLTGASNMALDPTGLSYAGHFAAAGGAIDTTSAGGASAYKAMDSSVPRATAGDNSTHTLYLSFLLRPTANHSGWGNGINGVAIGTQSGNDGFIVGYEHNDNGTPGAENLVMGYGRYGSYESPDAASTLVSTVDPALNTTYLVLAKIEYTVKQYQSNTATYSLKAFSGGGYASSEAAVTWDATGSFTLGENFWDPASFNMFGISKANDESRALIDDVRVGTTFGDVMAVPEPASLALMALGGLAMLRRRG